LSVTPWSGPLWGAQPALSRCRTLLDILAGFRTCRPMQDLIAALVAFFIIDPVQAEMAEKLAAASAPQAIVTDVAACVRTAAPIIVQPAVNDPVWAAGTIFQLWVGSSKPDAVLLELSPSCAPAVRAASPFLEQET
jgi:hypothetical protein